MTQPRAVAFLPVITKARELEARVLLAAYLLKAGYTVVLGRAGEVNHAALNSRNGLYFSPLLVRAAAPRLAALKARGHIIIGWDEEGLVYPDPDWYFSNRVSSEAVKHIDALIAWGPVPARDLAATLPPSSGPILPFGNARIDLLREPYSKIYEPAAMRLRERFGRYILVNTNFDLVNHIEGPDGLVRRMRASGRIAGEADEQKFAQWGRFRQRMFDSFMEGLPVLHDALPELTFVLRPHPSENLAPWHALAARFPRIVIEPPRNPVYSWIMGAQAVLHNSCTTAVEAFMFGVPVIAYCPPAEDGAMDSPLPNQLSRVAHSWQEIVESLDQLGESGRRSWFTNEQKELADSFIGGRSGAYSSERLVELAKSLGGDALSTHISPQGRTYRAVRTIIRNLLGPIHHKNDNYNRFKSLVIGELSELFEMHQDLIEKDYSISTLARDIFLIETKHE